MSKIVNDNVEDYTKFWVLNSNASEQRNDNVYDKIKSDGQIIEIQERVGKALDVYNKTP